MEHELHESLRPRLLSFGIFVGLVLTLTAGMGMGSIFYFIHLWKLGAIAIAVYVGIMVLAYRRLWGVYLEIRPKHTQADVKVFNKQVRVLNFANSLAVLALSGLSMWLRR